MKRALGISALIACPLILFALVPLHATRGSQPAALSVANNPPDSLKGFASSASWLQVIESLVSLSTVQRSLAAAENDSDQPLSDLELLTAQVTTTGLGPIKIGMSVEEIQAGGIDLVPSDGKTASGNCQYYQVKGLVEPIEFMAVDDRIIRVDISPGSFAETLSGAKIGTSEADILNLYGDQIEVVPLMAGGNQLIFTPSDPGEDLYRLVFQTDASGTVIQYRAGQFPAVTWPQGCG